MKLDELRELREAATPKWRARVRYPECLSVGERHVFHTRMRSATDARLAALAPDLARLVEELAEALNLILARCEHPGDYLSLELGHIEDDARAALASLAELGERKG